MVRSSWYCVRFTRVVCAKCATGGKMMMLSVVLSIGFTVNKMILEISIRAKIRTNERHDETSERKRIVRYSKSKPDDFLRAKYEHMMGGSGLIGFLQFLRGWKRPLGTTKAVLGACEGRLHITEDMPKDIATQMWYLALASVRDYQLPFGNR